MIEGQGDVSVSSTIEEGLHFSDNLVTGASLMPRKLDIPRTCRAVDLQNKYTRTDGCTSNVSASRESAGNIDLTYNAHRSLI